MNWTGGKKHQFKVEGKISCTKASLVQHRKMVLVEDVISKQHNQTDQSTEKSPASLEDQVINLEVKITLKVFNIVPIKGYYCNS